VAVAWDGAMTTIGDARQGGSPQARLSRGLFGENLSAPQGRYQSVPREATQLFFGNCNFAVTSEQQWHQQEVQSTTPLLGEAPLPLYDSLSGLSKETRESAKDALRIPCLTATLSYFVRVSPECEADSARHRYSTTIKHLALLPGAPAVTKADGVH
jgi:hypothetical protein